MTTAVQHRRGTTAEHATFTGLEGEVTIDTTKDTAVIHDGTLAGGYPLAKENLANVNPTTLSTIDGASTASDDKFLIWDQSALTLKSITRAELNNAMEADALASVTITGGTINGTSIGATTASSGAFTTLSASSTVTLSGGTANGVAYLNGSKVLTSGSALVFTGTRLGINKTPITDALEVGGYATFDDGTNGRLTITADTTKVGLYATTTGFAAYEDLEVRAANHIFKFNGSSEGMRLTSTGLGIGTSSPARPVSIGGAGNRQYFRAETTTNNNSYEAGLEVKTPSANFLIGSWGATNALWIYDVNATTERLRLDSSGNLGLGVTPSAWGTGYTGFDLGSACGIFAGTSGTSSGFYLLGNSYYNGTGYIYKTSTGASRLALTTGGFQFYTAPSGTAGNAISFTQAATLTADGNFLVGTTSTTGRITSVIGDGTAGSFTNSSASASYTLAVNNNAASGTRRYVNFAISGTSTGEIYSTGTVTVYGTTSDYRLKTVIGVLSGAGARIDALEPIEYEWKSSGERTRGFLAHKFQEIYPQSVSGQKDAIDSKGKPVYQSMQAASAEVIADIVAEIQSLRQRVAQLEQA